MPRKTWEDVGTFLAEGRGLAQFLQGSGWWHGSCREGVGTGFARGRRGEGGA